MVAVAAIFIHYQLTPTRRSRGQVIDVQSPEPLRIRSCTIAVHFVYVYVLLIRKLRIRIRILICLPHLYTYMFTADAIRYILLPALLPPPFTCLLFRLYVYSPYPTYLYDLRGETGATLFRLSCLSYIRILILIRPTYRCRCGTPG